MWWREVEIVQNEAKPVHVSNTTWQIAWAVQIYHLINIQKQW